MGTGVPAKAGTLVRGDCFPQMTRGFHNLPRKGNDATLTERTTERTDDGTVGDRTDDDDDGTDDGTDAHRTGDDETNILFFDFHNIYLYIYIYM